MQGWKRAPERVRLRVGQNTLKWGPDAVIRLWDEASVVQLLEQQFPEWVDWFLGLQRVISKCDAARAFILHAFGGVYADCDFDPNPETIASFSKMGDQRVVFVGSPWYGANNFLIASPPKAAFWLEEFLPSMQDALAAPTLWDIFLSIGWSTWPVLSSSGPVAVARMVARRPDLAFALPGSTEWLYGFHGAQDADSNSSWYKFRAHRVQQLMALLLAVLAFVGLVLLPKAVV